MPIEIRPVLHDHPDEDAAFNAVLNVDERAFGNTSEPDVLVAEKGVVEVDRAVIAWDGSDSVGCAAVYSFDLSVPGGSVPTGGVTWVGVIPTHRRRGVMSSMLSNIHDTMHEAHREPIAALWASQSAIYPRFGYGLASQRLGVVVPRAHGAMSRAPRDESLQLRMLDSVSDSSVTQPVFDSVRAERAGIPSIDDRWHARSVSDPKSAREGASELRTVVVEDDNGSQGYVRYTFKHDWSGGFGDGTIDVRLMQAVTPTAAAELWRYLIEFDLSGRVDAWNLPSDDPVQFWLDEPRRSQRQLHDQLYVRIIDLPEALIARRYRTPLDVVFDVRDEHCPWNAGRWRLAGDTSGATCTRTTDSSDISVDVTMLGATYLGGTTLADLAHAGWVTGHNPAALEAASLAMSAQHEPWCPFVF